jgi:osmotically-inducible protein OsmY
MNSRLWNVGALFLTSWVLLLALMGCVSDPNRTHRSDVLDDQVTSERVKAELSRAGKGFKQVTVRARNGKVTLSGTVGPPEAQAQAGQIARTVPQVDAVNNELETRR